MIKNGSQEKSIVYERLYVKPTALVPHPGVINAVLQLQHLLVRVLEFGVDLRQGCLQPLAVCNLSLSQWLERTKLHEEHVWYITQFK